MVCDVWTCATIIASVYEKCSDRDYASILKEQNNGISLRLWIKKVFLEKLAYGRSFKEPTVIVGSIEKRERRGS